MQAIDQSHIYRKYKGEWVCLEEDQKTVVASGKTLREALGEAKSKGKENPLVFKVPKDIIFYVG